LVKPELIILLKTLFRQNAHACRGKFNIAYRAAIVFYQSRWIIELIIMIESVGVTARGKMTL